MKISLCIAAFKTKNINIIKRQIECIKSAKKIFSNSEIIIPCFMYESNSLKSIFNNVKLLPYLNKIHSNEYNDADKPFIKDYFEITSHHAKENGSEWFGFSNSDLIFTNKLADILTNCMHKNLETVIVSRTDFSDFDDLNQPIAKYIEFAGYDAFFCRQDWWEENKHRFSNYFIGERAWDDAYAAIMLTHSRSHLAWEPGTLFHQQHEKRWKLSESYYAKWNINLYSKQDRYYSRKFESFIEDILEHGINPLPSGTELKKIIARNFNQSDMHNRIEEKINLILFANQDISKFRKLIGLILRTTPQSCTITVISNNHHDFLQKILSEMEQKGTIDTLITDLNESAEIRSFNKALEQNSNADYNIYINFDSLHFPDNWLDIALQQIKKLRDTSLGGLIYYQDKRLNPNYIPHEILNNKNFTFLLFLSKKMSKSFKHFKEGTININETLNSHTAKLVRSNKFFILHEPQTISLTPSHTNHQIKAKYVTKKQNSPNEITNIGMVTYNRIEFTIQSIKSILSKTNSPYILTVVDNNSTDNTKDYLSYLKKKNIIHNLILLDNNVGVAKASNLAWSIEPNAKYYLKIDNDIVIQKSNWLSNMIEVIEKVKVLGAVAYNFEPASYPLHTLNGCKFRIKSQGNLGGACILIPRRTHEKLGFWSEDYGLYGEEDYDYGMRIRMAGLFNAYMEDENIGVHLPAGKAALIDQSTYTAKDGVEEFQHAEYRKWKDEARKKTINSGILTKNLDGYQDGSKNIYVESEFARNYLTDHTPKSRTKKLKIAVLSFENKNYACAQLRIIGPAVACSQHIDLEWPTQIHAQPLSYFKDLFSRTDLVIIQRFFPGSNTIPIIHCLKSSKTKYIYETDDYLLDIPETNPHRDDANKIKSYILETIHGATAVTVSTEHMKQQLINLHEKIHILPNFLDENIWISSRKNCTKKPITIGYAGTPDHKADLQLLEEVLTKVSTFYKSKLAIHFMGCTTKKLSQLPGYHYTEFNPNYIEYSLNLKKSGIDIGLVPLIDNTFNQCKSNIKWLEYSACDIAGIFSELTPYTSCVKNFETGILVNGMNPKEWIDAICFLIDNNMSRVMIAKSAKAQALSSYTLREKKNIYVETWTKIFNESC